MAYHGIKMVCGYKFNVFTNIIVKLGQISTVSNRYYNLFYTISVCRHGFSRNPPIGSTRPRNVISPVIAILLCTGIPVKAEIIAVAIVTPADGPSFGTAPPHMI